MMNAITLKILKKNFDIPHLTIHHRQFFCRFPKNGFFIKKGFFMAKLLTVKEVADILRFKPLRIREFIENKELPAVQIGRSWRIEEDDLNAFIASRKK